MAFTDALESSKGYTFVSPTFTGTLNTVFTKEVFDEFKTFKGRETLEIYYWHLDSAFATQLKGILEAYPLLFNVDIISQNEDTDAWAFVQIKDKKGIHSTGA